MGQPQYPPPSSERWNINLPAVTGVVFVFLVGVVVWVVVASGGDDEGGAAAASSSSTASSTVSPSDSTPSSDTVPGTTTPAPMPSTSVVTATTTSTSTSSTTSTTTVPASTTTPTTAPDADPDAVPGDLGIDGRPMQSPACDGSFITVLGSAVGSDATAAGIEAVLDTYAGSEYLRTDQSCSSLAQSSNGDPIYVVYLGPFAFAEDACTARSEGPDGAYARQMSNDVGPNEAVDCG